MITEDSNNPRARKLNVIMMKIAAFMLSNTRYNEQEAHDHMFSAIKELEKAAEILIANDKKAA